MYDGDEKKNLYIWLHNVGHYWEAFGGNTKRERLSRLRRKLAERLVSVKNETAMLTTFNEVDMKAIIDLRNQNKDVFLEKYKVKFGFMGLFTKACTEALREFPALNSQLDLFYSPSELNKNNLPKERIKLGGMVKKGSIKYEDTKVLFVLTDFEEDLDIEFDGIPPDLFKEDSGAVMLGSFDGNGVFVAEEVFAKHDEDYMPPELSK